MNAEDNQEHSVVCESCGAQAPSKAVAVLTWSKGRERGRSTWTCERCSRDNVRAIESKLDPAWW